MMSGNEDDSIDIKPKVSNGFADSILASSPSKTGTLAANTLSDGFDPGEINQDISKEEQSYSSDSDSTRSCSPRPNVVDQGESKQDVNYDSAWSAPVNPFTNPSIGKDMDSGFISPEGATNIAGDIVDQDILGRNNLHTDLMRQSSDGLMEYEDNTTCMMDDPESKLDPD